MWVTLIGGGKKNPGHVKDLGEFTRVPVLLSGILRLAWGGAVPSGVHKPLAGKDTVQLSAH